MVTDSGHEYYEMLFMYVDGILSVSHKPQEAIAEIANFFKPKDGSIKEPKIYLGGDVAKMQLPNGREEWMTSPRTYIENAVKVIEQLFICLKNDLPLVQNDNYSEPKLVCRQLFSHIYKDIKSVYTFFQFLSQQISK